MDDEEELPAGCACCLTVIMLPVLLFTLAFILMWFLPA